MIDTTDSAKATTEEVGEKSKEEPTPSNEAKSDIQRALNMTDELNNHATLVFEQHDDDQKEINHDDLQKNFVDATKFPDRKVTLHQLYIEEMEYFENL